MLSLFSMEPQRISKQWLQPNVSITNITFVFIVLLVPVIYFLWSTLLIGSIACSILYLCDAATIPVSLSLPFVFLFGDVGKTLEKVCEFCHITLNKVTIFDDNGNITPGGVRIGMSLYSYCC